ncbi:MAG: fibronectin type III domain-containing protein [Spirochaetales bacterium]|jgi:hypothetical protein|nr:fibronectin type III domain-containing protein [Spirochaetales bacterium]
MKAGNIGRLLALFIVVVSCSQDEALGYLSGDPSDLDDPQEYRPVPVVLTGSSAASAYLTQPQPYPSPNPVTDADKYFFNYRLEKFAPTTEPFIAETFGTQFGIKQGSFWEHNSYNSHAVGFATNLWSISVIEYGETASYGSHTAVSESYFYNHLHYLKGLQPGKTYHYRVFARDYSGKTIALPDTTFTTKTFSGEVRQLRQNDFTHNAGGVVRPGLFITTPGTYVFMEDVTTNGLGINVKSSDVTIDLNGHTLIYDNANNPFDASSDGQYNESGSWGIRAGLWNFVNTKIYNGVVKQGAKGTPERGPLFLYHMGGSTHNEIAGLTVDYYSGQTSGMYVGKGYTHHNILYDRGGVVTDRHMAVRALIADPGAGTEATYNSLRRFRQRGIDGATLVRENELYCDSFDTNSFALGAGNGATVKDNKVFGMGYNPIGIGWGNDITVTNNFIYLRGFAPTQRSTEYARISGVAGMRVTNYDSENLVFENMLFQGNIIVLKAEDECNMARGIWTINGAGDKNIVYRNNKVKVEAMPGNFSPSAGQHTGLYYNGDVNNAIAAVSIQGLNYVSEAVPTALIFEDNHFISNVNHIIIGEGYGITSGARFYRTTLEKIRHDSDHGFFAPVRLGFWYWTTQGNSMTDTKLIGITESEMTPDFYGGTGKMEIRYGERKALTFKDENGRALANKTIVLTNTEDDYRQTIQTDGNGKAVFDLLTVRHFKYGNSQENGGVAGTPARTDYQRYIFNAKGYRPYSSDIAQWRTAASVLLSRE